ncbi:hypothetical protein [Streptomyces sp. NPDC005281]|uniref:hypothetical protein n=1 Tax=Streptomyces sp. NPDC005281 TaxID=3155712 RepID=UPI0033A0C40F
MTASPAARLTHGMPRPGQFSSAAQDAGPGLLPNLWTTVNTARCTGWRPAHPALRYPGHPAAARGVALAAVQFAASNRASAQLARTEASFAGVVVLVAVPHGHGGELGERHPHRELARARAPYARSSSDLFRMPP